MGKCGASLSEMETRNQRVPKCHPITIFAVTKRVRHLWVLCFVAIVILLCFSVPLVKHLSPKRAAQTEPFHASSLSPEESNLLNWIRFLDTNGGSSRVLLFVPQKLIHLTPDQFQRVILAAERSNDIGAAMDLAMFYTYVLYDVNKQIKYLEIGANNGDVLSEYDLGFAYYSDPQVKNIRKARYWLRKAADSGDEEAKDLLQRMASQ